jgi:cation:H+ antiporter
LYILIGLLCLVVCSSLFVRGASAVAVFLGVSDVVIGLTIVAGGTSLPELATSVVAARKGQSALAIGNVVGSCIYNILFILGLTGVICPMATNGITQLDYVMMNGSVLLMWLFCYSRFRVSRGEGCIMMSVFLAYMAWIVFTA